VTTLKAHFLPFSVVRGSSLGRPSHLLNGEPLLPPKRSQSMKIVRNHPAPIPILRAKEGSSSLLHPFQI
jgi:hypothetical protein